MKGAATGVAVVVLFGGCTPIGPSPQARATPKPSQAAATPSPSPSPKQLLFAVLQPGEPQTSATANHDTVLIMALDGSTVAKASFQPRKRAFVGNAAPLLQPEARTAAGKVYYADGSGAVRALGPDGSTVPVTSFAITTGQQELSFAVKPDGGQIWAVILHMAAVKDPPPAFPGDPFVAGSHWFVEVLTADAGSPARSLYKTDLGIEHQEGKTLSIVGWDATGPVVTTDTGLGTQNTVQGRQIFGTGAHLDASGKATGAAWGADCYLAAVNADGTALCGDRQWKKASVRSPGGSTLWSLPSADYLVWLTLAPDGAHATTGDVSFIAPRMIVGRDGSKLPMASGFNPYGWLDKDTVIGRLAPPPAGGSEGDLAYVRLSDPGKIVDLGLKGDFAGVVTSP